SCDNSYGTVTLNLQGTGTSRITVDNSFGDIMVEIPAGTEARVEASTSYGVVKSEIRGPGVQTTSSGTDFRSGPTDARMQITLNTSYGDIEVRSAGN
ncbi:MAG: DUF4097 family beta strand repeat-containing protein, partial [Acidobacteria bacterium]|nr:DUF4097 family beta strand repeat-containing protein [Acidobacteriota bacterium]